MPSPVVCGDRFDDDILSSLPVQEVKDHLDDSDPEPRLIVKVPETGVVLGVLIPAADKEGYALSRSNNSSPPIACTEESRYEVINS